MTAVSDDKKINQTNINQTAVVLSDDLIETNVSILRDHRLKGSWYGSGGWLPHAEVMDLWRQKKIDKYTFNKDVDQEEKNGNLHPTIIELKNLIKNDPIIAQLAKEMIKQNKQLKSVLNDGSAKIVTNTLPKPVQDLLKKVVPNNPLNTGINPITQVGILPSIGAMLLVLNGIMKEAPQFHITGHLVGVPVAALFTVVNATLAGEALFRLDPWNDVLAKILNAWGQFLYTPESFPPNNKWLSVAARKKWDIPVNGESIWEEPVGGWKSWNDFFARDVKRKFRPIACPDDDNIISSCVDGFAFRWRSNIQVDDAFWLKNMPYSLSDIFGKKLNKYAKRFEGGQIFQSFLSPYSYHCWWSPVSGTVKEATVIPGFYASKRVLPDFDGATTESLPYLLNVNCRGIVIIETKNIGLVCAIPIGMVDVSSILFDPKIKKGCTVTKGEKLGNFAFGGSSSFAIIFEDVRKYKKQLIFYSDRQLGGTGSVVFPSDAPQPDVGGGVGIPLDVGMQIGVVIPSKNTNYK